MANIVNGIRNYVAETRSEAKKVTWPSRAEVLNSTRVILWVVLILGTFVTLVDFVLGQAFHLFRQGL